MTISNRRASLTAVMLAALIAGCGSGGAGGSAHGAGNAARGGTTHGPQLSISPAGGVDSTPDRGLVITAAGTRIRDVTVRANGQRLAGKLHDGTVWRSTWALSVSTHYAVSATAIGPAGERLTATSSFRTFKPRRTFTTQIIEGYRQTYGVGMPIILYFNRPITNRAAVERSLQVKTTKRVAGAWYWDTQCSTAVVCAYFRPRHYWPPHTRVTFTGHLNGIEGARGVYGDHTLTQTFMIGSSLIVIASTATHSMRVYRDGRLFAHWPISTGRPGDWTPDGQYLTIEKANPVDMRGPGYNIKVPWSVRFTWSGDYLHDAYWSVGAQGFTNVSHGCVNMSPADAEIYYKLAVPGDPVKIVGSPRTGTWDNGWTMWFLSWHQWLGGSALHEAVQAGAQGSKFVRA